MGASYGLHKNWEFFDIYEDHMTVFIVDVDVFG